MEDFRQVQAFKRQIEDQRQGLYHGFISVEEFRIKLDNHLTLQLRSLRDSAFGIRMQQAAANRVFNVQRKSELTMAKRSVERLRIDFNAEMDTRGGIKRALANLNKVSTVLTEHAGQWMEFLTPDGRAVLEGMITATKRVGATSITYETRDELERYGPQLFNCILEWLNAAQQALDFVPPQTALPISSNEL